jgi:glyoxylase-like metal-dependent hydrolase (beta-lactamase superfamily II)
MYSRRPGKLERMGWVKHMKIGRADVYSLTDGQFRLDGGSMFGTVPRVLWQKLNPPDDQNRIALRINPLLIQHHDKNILVETGMDDQSGPKFDAMFAVGRDETVFDGLKSLGLEPNDIDLVINTHLHFDHAGRNTTVRDGKLGPTFMNARYIVQAQEIFDATHPHERNQASYHAHNFEPILEAGLFDRLEGETEILPGLRVMPVPGHNLGQQAVMLESEGQALVYTADLLPTFDHAPYPYIMGFDLYPVTTLEVRKRVFPDWAERGVIVGPPHDPRHSWGLFKARERGGFDLGPVELGPV